MQQINPILTRGVAEILPQKDTLEKLMNERKIRVFLGIDPTGSLLTLGHSVVLRKLQQFADAGHEVILLIGNGTVRIGDPTGKDTTRPVLTDEQIQENFKTWKEQASLILDFDKIKIVHNGDWLDKLTFADIVKLMAKTTVQQLMERDMFQERVKEGKPVHGHEIMYPLLQGYDSVEMEVDLEIGGTDQTFNMMMGRTLLRSYKNKEKWVLTTPIINGTDGRKMSKSYGNFIALTENSNDMYGKLMSIADEMIVEYFTLLTDVSLEKIESMKKAMDGGENPMQFKKQLAFTITEMYHDTQKAQEAEEFFKKTVQEKDVEDAAEELEINNTLTVAEAVSQALPDQSNSQNRRLIEQGAVSVNDEKKKNMNEVITLNDGDILKVGKRNFFKIVIRDEEVVNSTQ